MEFDKPYNRKKFVDFLQNSFLPEDFVPAEDNIDLSKNMKYSTSAKKLGTSESLDLVVYEVKHNSKNDARVSLSKEAFRMLADENQGKALVIFVPEDNNDNYRFSLIEISIDLDSSRIVRSYSNPRRYSYLLGKGIAYYTPNKYLNKERVKDEEDLRNRFSVEVLTKEFYSELSNWYAWAIEVIRFPNKLNDDTDNAKYNNESAIRMITRLIFVWFLKQKDLIPDEFFDEKYIAEKLIDNFNPHVSDEMFGKSNESRYYKAILQNLFFAMLNSPIINEDSDEITERRFCKYDENGSPTSYDFDNNKLMRYEAYFKDSQAFVDIANKTVPFLNGGLFECLDDKDNNFYYDGFSDRKEVKDKLIVPDFLFFGGNSVDLSGWYGDKKKKKVTTYGIIDILKRYNFTIEENTPFDKEVSLDPELLGKVFENLLASYNPETQTTARKQTGSFYTPREIVQYMVDESLVAHLKRNVGEELELQYRQLLKYTDDEIDLTEEQRKQIMKSLYECKILDPACGSGAFPMGMLQQMVHILNRIDPDNSMWKKMIKDIASNASYDAYQNFPDEEIDDVLNDIKRNFDESKNRPDYARKLYLIENCIYGVDIQPIAIQISKLRFFISLVVDQQANGDPSENFGIRPLPNLETKFVAANTLIGVQRRDKDLFDSDVIYDKEKEIKLLIHKIFRVITIRIKHNYRERIKNLRNEIGKLLKESGAFGNEEVQQLISWDMFDQNAAADFFDPEWMFGIKEGFDIVIGNPPYISAPTQKENPILCAQRQKLIDSRRYETLNEKWDLYIPFMEFGMQSLSPNGILTMIVPYPLTNQKYGKKMRKLINEQYCLLEIVDLNGTKVFENATVSNCIPFIQKSEPRGEVRISQINDDKKICEVRRKTHSMLIQDEDKYVWNLSDEVRSTNRFPDMNVLGDFCYISKGMVLNADEKTAKGDFKKDDLISDHCDETHSRKYIEAKDIDKYEVKRERYLEWNTERCPDKLSRPTFRKLYDCPKIVMNCLGTINANIDTRERYLHNHSIYCAVLWKDLKRVSNKSITSSIKKFCNYKRDKLEKISERVDLFYLLGILNSSTAALLLADQRGGDYHIYPEHIRNIPIPAVSQEQQAPIVTLVKSILTIKSANPKADISEQQREIDSLVSQLYGLTEENS